MSKTVAGFTMSLDGFIADANDDISRLFRWYRGGDTDFPVAGGAMVFKVSRASAEVLRERFSSIGAVVTGRRDFDVSKAWGGAPPLDVPIFILTHRIPPEWDKPEFPFTFVTDGIASAIVQARQAAGDKIVAVGSSTTTQQALRAGLLDEIHVDLVPVLLGTGIRLFDQLGPNGADLETIGLVQGQGVTHLRFRVVK